MGKLILTHEGTVIREFALDKERTMVGRKPHNDIQLDDPTVSGEHAVFLNLKNVYIEDLNSTNGVLLNGKKVSKRQLEHGDVVRIGRHELKFIDEKATEFESTVIIAPAQAAKSPDTAAPQEYIVKVISGANEGEEIKLTRAYTTLGKPGGQVAVIARRGNAYYMMPMGGTGDQSTHPKINGQPLMATSVPLHEGDELEVAGAVLRFTKAE